MDAEYVEEGVRACVALLPFRNLQFWGVGRWDGFEITNISVLRHCAFPKKSLGQMSERC